MCPHIHAHTFIPKYTLNFFPAKVNFIHSESNMVAFPSCNSCMFTLEYKEVDHTRPMLAFPLLNIWPHSHLIYRESCGCVSPHGASRSCPLGPFLLSANSQGSLSHTGKWHEKDFRNHWCPKNWLESGAKTNMEWWLWCQVPDENKWKQTNHKINLPFLNGASEATE